MKAEVSSRVPGLLLSLVFIASAIWPMMAFAGADGQENEANFEIESNDVSGSANPLEDGEITYGSLLTTSQYDITDYFKINVPKGMVLNASLYLAEYNESDPGEYNFQFYLYRASGSNGEISYVDWAQTYNRWESVSAIQMYAEEVTFYVIVQTNWSSSSFPHTKPSCYTVSASISQPAEKGHGSVSGDLASDGPAPRAFYMLTEKPSAFQQMRIRLASPQEGSFSLYVYFSWARNPDTIILQNGSWDIANGSIKDVVLGGSEGTYYIVVKARCGGGHYTLSTEVQNSQDDNNVPSNAQALTRSGLVKGSVDQGADIVDWYKLNVRVGYCVPSITLYMGKESTNVWNPVNFSLFNDQLGILYQQFAYTNMYNPVTIEVDNLTTDYNGSLYICVRTSDRYESEEASHMPSRVAYNLTVVLPNQRPELNSSLPAIDIMEDSSCDTLVLSNFVYDPDGDNIRYSLLGGPYRCRPVLNQATGRVNFTPEAHWFGTEVVKFRAADDGSNRLYIDLNTTVKVQSVNDLPRAVGAMGDLKAAEDEAVETPDLATIFFDADNPFAELQFKLRAVSSDTRPSGAKLAIAYDAKERVFRLGPAHLFFGSFRLELSCSDGQPGSIPAIMQFNLTIAHTNHPPALKDGVTDPKVVMVEEQSMLETVIMQDLFTDPDLPEDYAGDTLKFAVSGMHKLDATLLPDGRLVIDTRDVEYYPGIQYEERLLLTARDGAGKLVTLNLTVEVVPVDDPPRLVGAVPEDPECTAFEARKAIFKINAADNDTPELSYSWYVDGNLSKGSVSNTFSLIPGYDMGGSVHTVRVEASDGRHKVIFEWTVTVMDCNRLPSGKVTGPLNMSKYVQGTPVILAAEGWDEDGDPLTFIWRDPAGKELGRGSTIKTSELPRGTLTIRLEINDTKGSTYRDVVIVVEGAPPAPAKSATPGFEVVLAVLAIGLAAVAIALRAGRGRK